MVFFLLFCFRLAKLEETLRDDSLSEQQKHEKRMQHAQKETEFLRLKRSRLGVEDFEPLKVIGRGAFGEVSIFPLRNILFHGSCYFMTENSF